MGVFDDEAQAANDSVRARANLRFGVDAAPDAAAQDQALARRFGLPPALIEQYRPDYQARAAVEDAAPVLEQSPKLRTWLADDVERAKIAHDNLGSMSAIEAAVQYLFSHPSAKNTLMGDIGAGAQRANRGAAGVLQAAAELPAPLLDFLEPGTPEQATGWRGDIGGNPLRRLAEGAALSGAASESRARELSPAQSSIVAGGVSSGVQSLTQNLLTLPLAFLPGGQPAALSGMVGMTGGQAYQDAREQGLPMQRALPFAASQAAIEYATERLPLSSLIGDVKAGAPVLQTLMRQVKSEVPGEQIATVLQDLNEWAVLPANADKTIADYLADRPGAAAQTLIATLVGVGGNVAVMRGIDRAMVTEETRRQRAQDAEGAAEMLARLHQLAAADKVLQRDPQTFEQFIEQAAGDGPAHQVFIDANALMQSGVADQVAAVSPAVAAQLAQAAQTGGQVAIPIAEYAARIAPTEYAQSLIEHLKTDPEGFSRAEAQAYMQTHADDLKAEVERALSEKQGDDAFKQSADAVRTEVKAQLDAAARFTPQVNDAYSSLVGSFYAVQAAKLGITPEAMFQRYPLRIQAQSVADGAVLDQPAYHGSPHRGIDAFSTDKIGTGEGAQAYGWGLYFASKKDVAEYYRKTLAAKGMSIDGEEFTPSNYSLNLLVADKVAGQDDPAGMQNLRVALETYIHENAGNPFAGLDDARRMADAIDRKTFRVDHRKGQLYEVDIPDDEHMLHWDKPLSEQPAVVQQSAKALRADLARDWVESELDRRNADWSELTGQDLYKLVQKALVDDAIVPNTGSEAEQAQLDGQTDKAAALLLADDGIKGIKYLDGTSRGAGEGSYNYVIFDGADAKITGTFYQAKAERKASTFAQAREAAKVFQGKPLTNAATGMTATVSRNSLDKMLSTKAVGKSESPATHALAVANADALFERAILGWSKPDDKGDPNIVAVHRFFAAMDTDAGPRAVKLTVKETAQADRANPLYTVEAVELNEKSPAAQWVGEIASADGVDPRTIRSAGDVLSLAQQVEQGNEGGAPLAQAARGSFSPATNTITLLKSADLSTFLHEAGHFFLEVTADMAARPDAPAQVQQDMAALLQWFGVESLDEWHGLDFEEKRSYHEQFARGFEAYLFEGKTPGIELQGVFQRFRAWLLNVYRDLTALNVELTPQVRGVFDRMLASSEQIALAEQGRSMLPMFASAEQAGMTPEEFAAYQALGVDATNDAIQELQARGLRDMQWMHNARGREIARLQREAASLRREARAQVRAEVMSEPVYRAWAFLTGNETEGGEPVGKLSRAALAEAYGGHDGGVHDKYALLDWKRLTDLRMTAADGLHPDTVAEMFGFSSGDELVRKLLAAEKPDTEIEALTDVRMLEEHGELSSPEAIAKAADQAIHNDARARFVATEANALAKATGQRKVLASAAKEFAGAMVSRLKVRDVKPGQYAGAEVRAAKAAEAASKSGDLAKAAVEKRNQLIQHYATRAAHDAQAEIDAALRYLKRFEGDAKTLDADYADQIAALLERFDLRKGQSLKAVDKRAALADWIKSQREAGFEPDIPADLENEAFRTSYKNLTVEEFRGLVDSVRQIEHLGRLKHKLLTAADQRAYEAVRDEIAASIRKHADGRTADTRTPTTNAGRAVQGLKRFWAAHIKVATWARVMDGGMDGGPVWEYFVRNANERGDMETTMRAEATVALSKILNPVFKLGKMGGKGQFFPSIGRSLNREARLAVALNTGNEGNMQRLLGGEGWTVPQIAPVLQSLTAQEWQAVQAVWDHFESYRPQIAAKERRVYGKEPAWIDPRPFAVTTSDGVTVQMRGGYYPIKYDPAASQRAEEHADAEGAKRQLQGAYTTATTRRSFTKARAEEVSGRPLLYTLSGLYSGVNDVIHDLAWHEWLVDANRLLRSKTIDGAIREHYGPEVKQQFKSWAADIAEGEKGADAAVDLALARLRQGISVSGLGFNVMSALMQPLGLTQSITRVGASWVGRGMLKYLAGPIDLAREINGKSEFMASRARTRFRELNELRNQVQDQSAFKELTGRYAFFLMMRCQQMVDVPTWWGAYEKAVAEGNDDDRAVALADQAVIDAQGGGQTKDLSAIERGGPAQKLFTVFYSFMNTALNIGAAQTMSANTPAKRAKLAADYALLYVAPAVLGYFLKAALTPGGAGDDDPEKLAKKLLANQIDYLMGLMVVVREFGEAAKTVTGANDLGRDYTGPAGLRLVTDVGALAKQAHQGEFDDAFRKAAVSTVGDLFGLPSAQINRTVTGTQAVIEGKTDNPAAIAFGFQERR